jgi:hypothetical protein
MREGETRIASRFSMALLAYNQALGVARSESSLGQKHEILKEGINRLTSSSLFSASQLTSKLPENLGMITVAKPPQPLRKSPASSPPNWNYEQLRGSVHFYGDDDVASTSGTITHHLHFPDAELVAPTSYAENAKVAKRHRQNTISLGILEPHWERIPQRNTPARTIEMV